MKQFVEEEEFKKKKLSPKQPILNQNIRGQLETECRNDPRLGWPNFEVTAAPKETGNGNNWQTTCNIRFGQKKISAIVKATTKKRARALAAEGLLRQVRIEMEKDPLPLSMKKRKPPTRNKTKKSKTQPTDNKNHKPIQPQPNRTHIFIVPPSPDPSTSTAVDEAINILLSAPQEKLNMMEIHSFRIKTPEDIEEDAKKQTPVWKYIPPVVGKVFWHTTSSTIEDTPFLSMFFWAGKQRRHWRRKRQQIFIFDNHPQVDNLVHLLEEYPVSVKKIHIMDFDAILEKIKINLP